MIKAENKEHLKELIKERIKKFGNNCDLNDIDVSGVTDMSWLFHKSKFNGDISNWDASSVTNMSGMFYGSSFNQDISKWDVSKATDMSGMFYGSSFNKDISKWNVSSVKSMSGMFNGSPFNQDISKWEVKCDFWISKNFDNHKFLPKNINGDIYFYLDINPKIILPLCLCGIKGKWIYSKVKNKTLKKALKIMKSNYKKYGFGEECLNETRDELISNNLEIYSYLTIEDLYFNHPHEFI